MRAILPAADNPVLHTVAQEIPMEDITGAKTRKLVQDMKKLLAKEEYGVALAAPQVGEAVRLFIVSGKALTRRTSSRAKRLPEAEEESAEGLPPQDAVYINPVMTKVSRGKKEKHEGCLSIRGRWGTVPRAEKATIRAYDEHGKAFTRGASGFLAHIFQHEMDHLEGILYTDKATNLYDDESETTE